MICSIAGARCNGLFANVWGDSLSHEQYSPVSFIIIKNATELFLFYYEHSKSHTNISYRSIGMVVYKSILGIKYWTLFPVTDNLKFYDNMRSYLTECNKSFFVLLSCQMCNYLLKTV